MVKGALWLSADLPQQARELLCSIASCMAVQVLCSLADGLVLKQQQATAKLQLMFRGCNSDAWTKPRSLD